MSSVSGIENAIRQMPAAERNSLVLRVSDIYWDAWEEQLANDFVSGRLDRIIAEAEAEIEKGDVRHLDEFLHDS